MNNEIVMVITNDNIDSIKINLKSTFKKFSQEKTIQEWTFMTQIQTTATAHNPRNKNTNTNDTNSTPS